LRVLSALARSVVILLSIGKPASKTDMEHGKCDDTGEVPPDLSWSSHFHPQIQMWLETRLRFDIKPSHVHLDTLPIVPLKQGRVGKFPVLMNTESVPRDNLAVEGHVRRGGGVEEVDNKRAVLWVIERPLVVVEGMVESVGKKESRGNMELRIDPKALIDIEPKSDRCER